MKNLNEIMKQAQAMQEKVAALQLRLENMEIEGRAGGGMVTVVLSGKHAVKQVKIDPSLMQPGDAEIVEDLIVAAAAEARRKVDNKVREEMQSLTGGLGMPPGFDLGLT